MSWSERVRVRVCGVVVVIHGVESVNSESGVVEWQSAVSA